MLKYKNPTISPKLLMVVSIFASVAIAIVATSRASSLKVAVIGTDTYNCQAGVKVIERSSGSSKRNASVCQVDSGKSFNPQTYKTDDGTGRLKETSTWQQAIDYLKSKGHTGAETCAYIKKATNQAEVEFLPLGSKGEKSGITIIQNDYGPYCVTSSILNSNQPASIRVESGSVRVASLLISGVNVPQPPNNDTYENSVVYSPASNQKTGWSHELKNSVSGKEFFSQQSNYTLCSAGGFDASTHYARIRRKLPEKDGFVADGRFRIKMDFELPSDFYQKNDSFMRILTLENYGRGVTLNGQPVGTQSSDEWRVGFLIENGSDQLFELKSLHKNHEQNHLTLWRANSKLATGRHTVEILMDPDKQNGSWEVRIDNQVVGKASGVPTVPSSVKNDDIEITRISGCIDGASNQDSQPVSMRVYSIEFEAS